IQPNQKKSSPSWRWVRCGNGHHSQSSSRDKKRGVGSTGARSIAPLIRGNPGCLFSLIAIRVGTFPRKRLLDSLKVTHVAFAGVDPPEESHRRKGEQLLIKLLPFPVESTV